MNSVPIYPLPISMCEECMNAIDDLITSGELMEVNERLEELSYYGFTCQTCLLNEVA